MKPALVLGAQMIALGVVRALGEMGVPTILFSDQAGDVPLKSRYVKEVIQIPDAEKHEDEFIEALLKQKYRFPGSLLVPSSDPLVVAIARHKARLSEHFVVSVPEWEIVARYIEKKYTYNCAESLGVPVPKTFVPTSVEDVERYAGSIGFPCLVKPSQSHLFYDCFKRKMVPVHNLDEMIAIYRQATEHNLDVMLQEIIPGDDDTVVNYNAYAWEGRSLVEFTSRHIRNAPPWFGSPRVALSEWIPEIIEPGRKALQSIGFYGYACTEFKRDARDGVYKLMEINGRHNRSGLLAVHCGINFPLLQYQHLMSGVTPKVSNFKEGVYWVDVTRDLAYSLIYCRQEKYAISAYIRPYLKPHVFAILDFKDMKPFIVRCRFLAKQLISRKGLLLLGRRFAECFKIGRWGKTNPLPATPVQKFGLSEFSSKVNRKVAEVRPLANSSAPITKNVQEVTKTKYT
jgi:D-aspartate ligase